MDAGKPIPIELLVAKSGNQFVCAKCHLVLVVIEPGGILGQELNGLDLVMILEHYLTKHGNKRPVNMDNVDFL